MDDELARAVEGPVKTYFAALNDKNLDGILEIFTPDAAFMPADAETAIGTEKVRAAYQHRFTMFDYARVLHVDEVIAEGGLGVVRCHSTGTLTLLGSGTTVQAVAREVFTLQKVDGCWMVRMYMNNLPKAVGSE